MAISVGFLVGISVRYAGSGMDTAFSPIDLLFYGLAIYTGYRTAFRKITEEELASVVRPAV